MVPEKILQIIERLPCAAGYFSSDGLLLRMNKKYESLFGVSLPALVEGRYNICRDELILKGLRSAKDLSAALKGLPFCSSALHYPVDQAEKNLGLSKKETLVLELIAFPVDALNGPASGTVIIFKDITEQQRRQLQVAESEKRYRTLMDALPDMVFCVAPDQTVLFVNGFSAKAFHATPEQLAGKKLFELFPKPIFERMWKNIQLVFETRESRYTENRTMFGETARWLDTWLVPLCDDCGSVYAIMGVSRDITEKIKYKEELEKTRNLESLGILAGGIAHDFNNILTAIQGNLSLLQETCAADTEQAAVFGQTEKAAERAKALTQQLLTFSKGGAPIRQQASVKELIIDSTGFIVHGSAVRAEFKLPDDLWRSAFDAGQISQVIQNLVINAMQSMPGGGVVTVSARNEQLPKGHASGYAGRYIAVSVGDHGAGISEENIEKIFIPFFTTKSTGNGLGLSICYSIIKKHEGFMNVDSRPGTGTTVSFYLPAAEEKPAGTDPRDADKARKDKKGKRILVIDDEAFVRYTLEKCLLHLGCRPSLAADGGEGLSLFEKARREGYPFDAVILDLTIPGGAGGSTILADLLKADPHVKAIVASGYANSPVLADPIAYGFKAVLRKPFSIADLENALDYIF